MVTSKDGNRLIVNKGAFQAAQEVKNLPVNAGDWGLIPESGISPEEGNGYLLQYSCLENSMDRGAWWAIDHGVTKSQTRLTHLTCLLQGGRGILPLQLRLLLTREQPDSHKRQKRR